MTARERHELSVYTSEVIRDRIEYMRRFDEPLPPLPPTPQLPPVFPEYLGPLTLTQMYPWWERDTMPERFREQWWRETQALDRQ